jgi:hypothetical protein
MRVCTLLASTLAVLTWAGEPNARAEDDQGHTRATARLPR